MSGSTHLGGAAFQRITPQVFGRDNRHRATRQNALNWVQEVRHGMHVLSSSELPAPELQLHASRHLPRVPEVPEALRVRTESEVTRVCKAEATGHQREVT
jgi:hypothetical protein